MPSNKDYKREEELQQEVTKLKRQLKKQESSPSNGGSGKWRLYLAIVLIIFGSLLAPLSVAANWLNLRVLDTDAYVETVAPLSEDPAIQNAVADYITTQLFNQVDVEQQAKQALPPKAQFLAGPLSSQMESFVDSQIKKVLASDKFNRLWSEANRIAHQLIINVILPKSGVLTSQKGEVSLDLSAVLETVKQSLKEQGIDIFDNVSLEKGKKFTIFKSEVLAKVQRVISLLNKLAIILPLLVILFFVVAVALWPNRRLAILWAGLGLAVSMVIIPIGIGIGRSIYLGAVVSEVFPKAAANAAYDTVLQSLMSVARAFFLLGIIVGVGAFLLGPSKPAIRVRENSKNLFAKLGKGRDFGSFGEWVAEHKTVLRIAGLIAGLVIIVFLKEVTALAVIVILVIYLVFLGLIELFGHKPLS